ncbi:MAG TPA: SurA N-terminal domain-containing protein [Burkholderiaceae bacterium]
MFDFVRTHNRLFQILLGVLIVPSFIAFGVSSYSRMNNEQSEAVAEVDGHDITRSEWEQEQHRAVDRMRARRPDADPKLLDSPEARRVTLDGLVRQRVLQVAADKEHLDATPERIDAFIRTAPEFAEYRALQTPAERAQWLAMRGMTQDSAYALVGAQLTQQQALRGVADSAIYPAIDNKASLDAWLDQRQIQWQRFDVKDYAAQAQPTDAQVQAYYADKAHAAQFTAPEQAKIEYVVLDAAALKSQVPVTDDLLHQYYDAHKDAFTAPEERRASHILVSVAPNATADEVAKAKARADALLAEVRKNPASFADVARRSSDDAGSKASGGDLDFMRRNAIPGPFSDALFSMKPGEISDVVRSDAGFHIIHLTEVRGGTPKPFDEVRAQVEDQYRLQQAQKLYQADADKFTNTVYEQPDSLQPVIDAFKLARQTATVGRKPSPDAVGPLASQRLLDAVFADETLHNKHNTEAIETANGQLTAAHLVGYEPQHLRPLSEVRDEVVAAVRQAQASAAAKKDGEARVEAARKDPSLVLPTAAIVGRKPGPSETPREVVDAALKADLSKGPTVVGLALPDGSYAAIRVLKVVPRPPAATDAEAQSLAAQVRQAYADAEGQALYDALKVRYKVKYHEDRIAKASAAASASN